MPPSPAVTDAGIGRLADEALRLGLHRHDAVVAQRLARNRAFLDPAGTLALPASIDSALLRQDPVIRRRLAQRLRYQFEAMADTTPPNRSEIESYLSRHSAPTADAVFVRAEIVRLAAGESDAATLAAARAVRQHLMQAGSAAAAGIGAALLETTGDWMGERTLALQLGAQLAAGVLEQPVGEWSQPLPAPTGVYMVRLIDRYAVPESVAAADARAQAAILADRRAAAVASGMAEVGPAD